MSPLNAVHVLILGLGQSGLAMARWCTHAGARVTVADTRSGPPGAAALAAECPQARFVSGPFSAALIDGQGVQAVYLSPGLAPAQTAPVVEAARAIGLPVGGELSLFAQALAALHASEGYAPQVLAITGTNGKTTVTALTAQLVAAADRTVAVAGNIGPTLLDTLAQRRDAGTLPQVWVLELSSFQLDGVQDFEPTAATVLNVSQDHLDWHGSMAAYMAAKARIFGRQALMVLNRDDPQVMAMHAAAGAATEPPKARGAKAAPPRAMVGFGAGLPTRAGDYGIETVNGMAWLVRAQAGDDTRKRRATDTDDALFIQRLMPADALRIRGRHNAVNALAALALASSTGAALAPMLYALREYRGEPHRVEPIGVLDGVEYFDDSKGTNVGATVAALNGLGADRRLVLILGGDGKGQDFSPLCEPVARHARAVLLIGRDAALIRDALAASGVPLHEVGTLDAAVPQAQALAQSGDAVLLSPACASLDQFRDYAHRADVFRAGFAALAAAAGQPGGGAA